MSRVFIEGFEGGDFNLWDVLVGGWSINSTTKKSGAYSAYHSQGGKWLIKYLPANDEYYFAYQLYVTNNVAVYDYVINLAFRNDLDETQISFSPAWNTNYWRVYRGWRSTLLATSGNPIPINQWVLLEGRIKVHPTDGIVQVKINGFLEIDFTGNTQGGSDTNITRFLIGQMNVSSNGWLNCYHDNIVIDNANWIGFTEILKKQVSGAGNSTQFTPSAGNNYQCVDEIPPSLTDYVYQTADGTKDDYACAPVGASGKVVKSVQVQAVAEKLGAPAADKVKLLVRSGGADYLSPAKEVSVGIAGAVYHMWENDPHTGSPWTAADAESANIGQQLST